MSRTVDELRELLKSNLHNDTTFTDPGDLNKYLTFAQRRIVRASPKTLGVKSVTVTTVASTQEYSIGASDLYRLVASFLASQNTPLYPWGHLEWAARVEATATIPSGPPERFNVLGYSVSDSDWRVRYYPTPDDAYSVKHFYYWMPADFSTLSDSDIPVHAAIGFDELLLEAATLIARSRNDPEGQVQSSAIYQELLRDYKEFDVQGDNQVWQLATHFDFGESTIGRLPPEYPRI